MATRKMPQNLDAEMSVISACLLMPSAADKVCENLSPEMFFSDANRKIFEAVFELHEHKKPIDYTTLTNELEKNNTLALIGGIEYLSDVVDSIVSAANVEYYMNKIGRAHV